MLNIINHLKNANQNHNEMGYHTHQDDYNQKDNNKDWQRGREIRILISYWCGGKTIDWVNSLAPPS